jgi:hypothetical protein
MALNVFTGSWWKSADARALRSALVIAVPYLPASYMGHAPYWTLLSAAAMGAILSFLTSLTGIAEVDGKQEAWYVAVFSRVTKTTVQAVITGFGTAYLFDQVNWHSIGVLAGSAALGSLFLALIADLPEADKPTAISTTTMSSNNVTINSQVPVVALAQPVTPATSADVDPEDEPVTPATT